ncbi:MAG: DUF1929 domain-containing protein [Alphaproteobacteria bacterium]|nr:DUF1929 domain-containing protein [Alphaproteobacteria bacterium]
MFKKKYLKILFFLLFSFFFLIITINSIFQIYEVRTKVLYKLGLSEDIHHINPEHHNALNTIKMSNRQEPPLKYDELVLNGDEHLKGAWTAPFDWNVIAIHSVLLPNGKVLTYGSYAAEEIEQGKDIREDKKMTLTDGLKVSRDWGFNQWHHHNINGGVDFDIWDPSKGAGYESHKLIKEPIVLDAFCSAVKIFDSETLFMLGGNKGPKANSPDTQKATTFMNFNNDVFTKGNEMHYARWYGSIVRLADDRIVMVGGENIEGPVVSPIPEILEKGQDNEYHWKVLYGAESNDLFGDKDADEWSYPKSYLASDGKVVGISYNKLWVLDPSGEGSVKKVGEIDLETDGIMKIAKNDYRMETENDHNQVSRLIIGKIGAGVGSRATSVMIDTDKILLIGGKQWGEYGDVTTDEPAHYENIDPDRTFEDYLPSNHVNLVDFSNSSNPVVTKMRSMKHPRADSNSTILPDGTVFVNGGHSYRETEFSVLIPEIYNYQNNEWYEMSPGTLRRNYHASSLLLPNGTVLVAGGDTWSAEIYYPPYLFEESKNNKTVFAKRPIIKNLDKKIMNRNNIKLQLDNADDISNITLISTGSVTHSQNSELKFQNLNFKYLDKENISFNIPKSKNIIQNGSYLIFAINKNGTPSIGKIVYIET